jgi:hypothetical protein
MITATSSQNATSDDAVPIHFLPVFQKQLIRQQLPFDDRLLKQLLTLKPRQVTATPKTARIVQRSYQALYWSNASAIRSARQEKRLV